MTHGILRTPVVLALVAFAAPPVRAQHFPDAIRIPSCPAADSLLGATLQSKRWCEQCKRWTERRVHTCQYRTRHARGVRWMTNDTVNLLATACGALAAVLAAA